MQDVTRILRFGALVTLLGLGAAGNGPSDTAADVPLANSAAAGSRSSIHTSHLGTAPGARNLLAPRKALPAAQARAAEPSLGAGHCLLPDGRLLTAGGQGALPEATVSLVDPRNGAASPLMAKLNHARAGASATVLPDGTVLVFGGLGPDNALVVTPEVFDPATLTSTDTVLSGLMSRAYHSATLLTDGTVLFAGGVGANGEPATPLQLWGFTTGQTKILAVELETPRSKHAASLLPDGTVLLWGGDDAHGQALSYGEVIDPTIPAVRVEAAPIQPWRDPRSPLLADSLPQNGATGVSVNSLLALRFSKPLKVETINTTSVVLSGPDASVQVKVVAAEGGMLAFVMPAAPLVPGTAYSLSISGASDNAGQALPGVTVLFTTQAVVSDSASGATAPTGSNPMNSSWSKLPSLQAPAGETALAGQSLQLDGSPLRGLSIEIDSQRASTDATGRFLLRKLSPGHHVMIFDGAPAAQKGRSYGIYRVGVDIQVGKTNVLGYTIWMTALDTKHVVKIPSPTTSDMVIVNPTIPGLELHLPADTVIRDARGQVVTEIGITPIPLGQPPFPLQGGVVFPVYFTIQPGGAAFSTAGQTWSPSAIDQAKGARIHYRNYRNTKPGTRYNFWNYDPAQKGWYVYGQGRVAADGRMIEPDAGVTISTFDGAMVSDPGNAPAYGPKSGNPRDADPVDLQTGLFVLTQTDLALGDVIPIALTRTYRPADPTSRAFGIGTSMSYNMFLVGDNINENFPEGYTYQDLILGDGGRIHFTRTSPCDADGYCEYSNAVYTATSAPGEYYGATIRWASDSAPNSYWLLTKKDGTVYEFTDSAGTTNPSLAAAIGMHDRYGNALTFTRDANGNLLKVTSPNGRWIQMTYDSNNRVTQAVDNIQRTVTYIYDTLGRLWTVTDANGKLTTYVYDSNGNMLTVQDPRGYTYITNQYDANARVTMQTLADNGVYQLAYVLDQTGAIQQVNVTHPMGDVRQVSFNSDGYMTSDTNQGETITYTRQAGSGLILGVTDPVHQTSTTYDNMGNVTSIMRSGATTSYVYGGPYDQVTSITDPVGNTTSYGYDSDGDLTSLTDPTGGTSTFSYNSAGQVLTATDANGNASTFSYTGGDLTGITDPLQNKTTMFVDSAGRLGSVTDASGNMTSYTYDGLDNITEIADPTGTTTLAYDADNNLTSILDAGGGNTSYGYDSMDRPTSRTDPLGRGESYAYNVDGTLKTFTDRKGQVSSFAYDSSGRVSSISYAASSVTYTYDSANRITSISDSVSGKITWTYDSLDHVLSEITPVSSVVYGYDTAGDRRTMTATGGVANAYSYDGANRVTHIAPQAGTPVTIGYDSAGNRTSVALPNGVSVEYGYDADSHVTSIVYANAAGPLGNVTYGYDANGRVVSKGGSLAASSLPSAMSSATYDLANELTQWGGIGRTYDANGNLTNDGARSFTWDARNRLVSISGAASASFQYDALGRRSLNPTGSQFVYDGSNPVAEFSGGSVKARFLSGLGLDEWYARTDTSGTSTMLSDLLGSALALTDDTGTVQTQYAYSPFGATTVSGSTTANSFAFTGREFDPTGLYYYRARYYDPSVGRFISEDPMGSTGSGPNVFGYVDDRPTNFTDPSGLEKKDRNKQCRDYVLRNAYPSIGNFMADTAVPEFSAFSIYDNFSTWAKGFAITGGAKVAGWGIPSALGWLNTATGNNLAAYPGMAGAAGDALETGAFWTNTAGLAGKGFEGVGLFSAFATGADFSVRFVCR